MPYFIGKLFKALGRRRAKEVLVVIRRTAMKNTDTVPLEFYYFSPGNVSQEFFILPCQLFCSPCIHYALVLFPGFFQLFPGKHLQGLDVCVAQD